MKSLRERKIEEYLKDADSSIKLSNDAYLCLIKSSFNDNYNVQVIGLNFIVPKVYFNGPKEKAINYFNLTK